SSWPSGRRTRRWRRSPSTRLHPATTGSSSPSGMGSAASPSETATGRSGDGEPGDRARDPREHPAPRALALHVDGARGQRAAERDEGNVWEALGEAALTRLGGDVLWIVDVNRQSLDRVVPETRTRQLGDLFRAHGWRVRELRWGRTLEAAFRRPGGERLRGRLETMPSRDYQRLLRLPAGAVRKTLVTTPDGALDAELDRALADVADDALPALVADVGGHDLASILDALDEAERERGRPAVILADTIKGWGLPSAADPLNHTMVTSPAQIAELRDAFGVAPGEEWAGFDPARAEAAHVRGLPPLWTAPRRA